MKHPSSPISIKRQILVITADILAACIITGCASGSRLNPALESPASDELTAFVAGQSVRPFKGSATIAIRSGALAYRGRMDILWRSTSDFSCDLYDPMGNQVAHLQAAEGATRLDYGSTSLEVDPQSSLHLPGILPSSPITFRAFVRILGGQLPLALPDEPAVDSLILEGRRLWFHFSSDSRNASVAVDKRSGALREAVCAGTRPGKWQVRFTEFRDGRAQRMRVDLEAGSFEVRYDKIIFLTGGYSTRPPNRGRRISVGGLRCWVPPSGEPLERGRVALTDSTSDAGRSRIAFKGDR